ncbi:unnamed protein product, partial [Staurois parvus]
HAAARCRVSHGSPCTASHCCCLHRHTLPCATFRSPHTAVVFHFCHRVLADYGPPIAAARPVICHGPLYLPPHAAARSRVCPWVPVRPLIAAVSIATLCHVPLSGLLTLLVVSIFVIGCCYGLPLLLPTATLWLHTLVLAP